MILVTAIALMLIISYLWNMLHLSQQMINMGYAGPFNDTCSVQPVQKCNITNLGMGWLFIYLTCGSTFIHSTFIVPKKV